MLPYPLDHPALGGENTLDISVPLAVSANLVRPILNVCFRSQPAFGATMPKATVNKYCESLVLEDEVGFPNKIHLRFPPFHAVGP